MSFFSFIIKHKFPSKEMRDTLLTGRVTLLHILFYVLIGGVLVLTYLLLIDLNKTLLVTIPAKGGSLIEGTIGAPRFINPILATTQTDIALSHLVFAGLMKKENDGTVVPELAETYTISPDNLVYTFTLREKRLFHNGTPLTTRDILFTFELLKNPLINARTASLWQQFEFSAPDERTIVARLSMPTSNFLELMTMGILSQEQWSSVVNESFSDAPENLSPVGAGAFALETIDTQNSIPTTLVFKRNRHYPLGAPLLKNITVKIFANQESLLGALSDGTIDFTFSLLPQTLEGTSLPRTLSVTTIPTGEMVGVYRHDSSSALEYAPLLALFNEYIDRKSIVDTVENGYGIPYTSPTHTTESPSPNLEEALASLTKLGYQVKDGVLTKGSAPVALGIAVRNDDRLLAAGRALSGQLTALGAIVEIQSFDIGTFQDELSRASFSLVLADGENTLPKAYSTGIPLYTDAVLLVTNGRAKGISTTTLDSPLLRYATVVDWHERTDTIYRWFTNKE